MPKMLQQLFLLIAIFASAVQARQCYEAGYSDDGLKVANCPQNADGCYYAWDCGDLGKDIRGCSLKGEYACNKVHPDFNQSLKEACKGNCNECDQGELCNRRSDYDDKTTNGGDHGGQGSTAGPSSRVSPAGRGGPYSPGSLDGGGQDYPGRGGGPHYGPGGYPYVGPGGGPDGRGGPTGGPYGGRGGYPYGGPDYVPDIPEIPEVPGPRGGPYGPNDGPGLECYKSQRWGLPDKTEKCSSGTKGCFVALNCMRMGRDGMSVSDIRDCAYFEDQCEMGYTEEPGGPATPWKTMCSSCNVCHGDGCNEHDGSPAGMPDFQSCDNSKFGAQCDEPVPGFHGKTLGDLCGYCKVCRTDLCNAKKPDNGSGRGLECYQGIMPLMQEKVKKCLANWDCFYMVDCPSPDGSGDRLSVKGCVPADFDICNDRTNHGAGTLNELCGGCSQCSSNLCNGQGSHKIGVSGIILALYLGIALKMLLLPI